MYLGRLNAHLLVVEFQKRGLPHAHILLIMKDQDKPRLNDVANIDNIVSAELPDAETKPHMFEMVSKHMMHGPAVVTIPRHHAW